MTSLSKSARKSKGIHAVILAAGIGNRLRPLPEDMPKCLVEVGEKPILFRQLTSLEEYHIEDVWIVVGYREELIRKYVQENFPHLNVRFILNNDFATTNTLYSLALAASKIPTGVRVLQLNGDVVFDAKILGLLLSSDSSLSFVAAQMGKCGEEEIKISLSRDGSVSEMNKSISIEKTVGEAIGINLFDKKCWRELAKHLSQSHSTHATEYFEYAVESVIKGGMKVFPLNIVDLRAIEIDFPEDLREAEQLFSITP